MTITIGVIGAGRIGKIHAETLATRVPQAKVVAIADVFKDAAIAVAQRFHIPQASQDYQAILNNPAIEAVIINTPTNTHAQLIEEAARAGKHIFCEKPIDFDLARIDHVLDVVEKAGVKLQIGFHRRFDPNFMRVRRAIDTGEIGSPHTIHIISRDPAPPSLDYIRGSGGLFFDMMIHDFDMARFLIDSEIEEVYALGGVRTDPAIAETGDIDTALVMFKYQNGVMGTIECCRRAAYGYDQRVEVFGSGGAANANNNYPNSAIISTGETIYHDLPLNFFLERYQEAYRAELAAFVDAVVNDTQPLVTGLDGRAPVVLGLAAKQSFESGRAVKLSEV